MQVEPGEEAVAACWASACALSLEQAAGAALALARELAQQPAQQAAVAPAARSGGLSRREVEVLRRIAAGRSTREIAAALAIAEGTVERHVTKLYRKSDAADRADATVYAFRHGLTGPGQSTPSATD